MVHPVIRDIEVQPMELFQVREVLRCILHTIFFNRALGLVQPVSAESQLFETISYVHCGDPVAAQKIEEKIEQLCESVERSPSFASPPLSASAVSSVSAPMDSRGRPLDLSDPSLTRAQITLSFFERRPSKRSLPLPSVGGVSAWFGSASLTSAARAAGSAAGGGVGSFGAGKGGTAAGEASSGSADIGASGHSRGTSKGSCWEQWNICLSVLPQRQAVIQPQQQQQQLEQLQQQQQREEDGQQPLRAATAVARSARNASSSCGNASEAGERQRQSARLESELRDILLSILVLANQDRERIPPVLTTDTLPFPFELVVPSLSESSFGMDLLKRMLQATPPPLLS